MSESEYIIGGASELSEGGERFAVVVWPALTSPLARGASRLRMVAHGLSFWEARQVAARVRECQTLAQARCLGARPW